MSEATNGHQRLHRAIRAALEAVAEEGSPQTAPTRALENLLARLDEKLGAEATHADLRIQPAPDHCVVVMSSSDPKTFDVVSSFMHHADARRLGNSRSWLLPLGGIPVSRWIRALRRVLASGGRPGGGQSPPPLAVSFTVLWAQEDELMVAEVG